MASAERTDWQGIAHEAARRVVQGGPSEEDGAALERRLIVDENDVEARVRLVGFYFVRFSPESHRRRAEHLAWLAERRPDVGLGGHGYIEEEHAPQGHEATRRAWTAAAAEPDADVRVLENAAAFLGFNRPEQAEPIFRRAAEMDPENGEWRKRIAWTLTKRAEWAEDPGARRRYARAAVEELETALTLAEVDWRALGTRIDLARAAVLAEDWKRARETAERVLVDNETSQRTFLYGNAIHWANITLGCAALAHEDLSGAAEYLVRAGKTPGSPHCVSAPGWGLGRHEGRDVAMVRPVNDFDALVIDALTHAHFTPVAELALLHGSDEQRARAWLADLASQASEPVDGSDANISVRVLYDPAGADAWSASGARIEQGSK